MMDGIPVSRPEDGHVGAIVFEEHALEGDAPVLDRPYAIDRGGLTIVAVGGPIRSNSSVWIPSTRRSQSQ